MATEIQLWHNCDSCGQEREMRRGDPLWTIIPFPGQSDKDPENLKLSIDLIANIIDRFRFWFNSTCNVYQMF